MKWLGPVFLAVVLPLLLSEFTDWCPWLAKHLVLRAVRRLPKDARDRWEEEWLGDLAAFEGRRLSILVRGLWIYFRVRSWGRMLEGLPPVSQVLLGRIKALGQRPSKPAKQEKTLIYLVNAADESMKGAIIIEGALENWLKETKATSVTIEAVQGHDGLVIGTDGEGNSLAITSWALRRRFRRTRTWKAPS